MNPNSRNRSSSLEKRKREELKKEEETIFQRSKRMVRSPGKQNKNKEAGEMEELKELVMGISTTIKEMRDQMSRNHEELREEIIQNAQSIEKLKEEQKIEKLKWTEEKEEMKNEILSLRKRLEEQDKKSRFNNIVVKGLQTDGRKPKEVVTDFLRKELQVNCVIK